ncbi:glycine zipper 2TM domain-containing protein [Sphingomonas radiodurans]|uniref:glycine zipper 2TM domain-containing protein n=1 Tax=Sphingomonas radiodurans TaxID=2890321 RepID=UPI001E2EAD66|nr:glycine zipper 2TM domain-containing protein [Sphingomonas radiodurans]WBH17896.1 glycine zipper 2TM domain-containing protein [Sphingomonas radiodurans]
MFKKLSLAGAALAMSTVAMIPAEASAQRYGDRYERQYRGNDNYRNYRGDDRRYYRNQRCNNGTTGTIVGAIAGGLLGRTIDSRGDRTLGTVLGGVGGAVAGNAIEKSGNARRCR